ncbi:MULTISPECIES: DUF4235 domain-containing protein [Streptomyces]|uniref:DUF4235 domain-containing protein n=1 Tax=Streptomyces TaxID=1883 RepID=UPI002109EDFE|nr:DUF4235 domain-containing protein [Streptomyces longispororuber]MCQ4207306.1 DUF4235 domain-containing protein [Streptomyces longispororuber]
MGRAVRIAYRPLGLVLGMAGGLLARAAFDRTWRALAGEDDAPDAMDEGRSWGEVLGAAVVQGAVFAVVKAAVDRGGAVGVRRLTGVWPG